jgi:hypothetical protein
MSYLLTTYHWPLLSRPRVAGFGCPVTRDDFFKIGFGLLVLTVRLGMIRYTLRRAGAVSLSYANELITSGQYITIVGLLVVSLGILRGWTNTEGVVMITAGAGTVMLLGIGWVLQGTVQAGRGTIRSVSIWACVAALIGVVLIALYLNTVY